MPTQTVDTNSLTFTAANQQWIVKAGVVISATSDNTNPVTIGFAQGQLFNHGDISSTGGGTFGARAILVSSAGANATIINGSTASIIGSIGVETRSEDTHLFNDGSIFGMFLGVNIGNFVKRADIHNDGYIFGKSAAIQGQALDNPKVVNGGVLESDGAAIALGLFSGNATIINTGKIVGGAGTAISVDGNGGAILDNAGVILGAVRLSGSAFASSKVTNGGLIDGDLALSSGNDSYNGHKGVVNGTVSGGGGEDVLKGGADDDVFTGDAREDQLTGGGGDDVLTGGARADKLKGGSGGDTFVYQEVDDSTGGFFADTQRDTIFDFRHTQDDRIDLRPIDAKIGGANQKFHFLGTADFTGQKGELRYFVHSGDAIVQADVSGDRKADMEIKLNDVSSLVAGDFFL